MPGCEGPGSLDRRDERKVASLAAPRPAGAGDRWPVFPGHPRRRMAACEGTGQVPGHSACAAVRQVLPASRAAGPTGKPAPPRDPGGPGSMAGGETLIGRRPPPAGRPSASACRSASPCSPPGSAGRGAAGESPLAGGTLASGQTGAGPTWACNGHARGRQDIFGDCYARDRCRIASQIVHHLVVNVALVLAAPRASRPISSAPTPGPYPPRLVRRRKPRGFPCPCWRSTLRLTLARSS